MKKAFLALCLIAVPVAAQKDFLTADEADQLREAQEADDRLKLYLRFAQQRVDLLGQLFAKQKTGRSGMIHDTLEQYTQIIEAIDDYIDFAIKKQKVVTMMSSVAKTEKELLGKLEKFSEQEAPDTARFKFALEQAIDATRDSAEMSEQDLKTRTREVEAKEVEIRKEREAMTLPDQKATSEADQKKIEAEKQGVPAGKKKPTLLRPGEKPKDPTQK